VVGTVNCVWCPRNLPEIRDLPVKDDLLDQLAGSWKLTGTAAGRPAQNDVTAESVLGHQFLRIRFENGPYSD